MITPELLTELAIDPYLRASYRASHGALARDEPSLPPGSFEACVGCCDPGADPMPELGKEA